MNQAAFCSPNPRFRRFFAQFRPFLQQRVALYQQAPRAETSYFLVRFPLSPLCFCKAFSPPAGRFMQKPNFAARIA